MRNVSDRQTGIAVEQQSNGLPAAREAFRHQKAELLKVSELMPAGQVLKLDHEGEIYTLRITRNRKLILTK